MRNFTVGVGVSIFCFIVGLYGFPFAANTWRNWFHEPTILGNYQTHFQATGRAVVMYGTEECPYCLKARAYFKGRGIVFADERVNRIGPAQARFKQLKIDGVPVILIGEHLIHGFDVSAIEYALEKTPAVANARGPILSEPNRK